MGTESLSGRQRAESETERFDQAADLALAALEARRKKSRPVSPLNQSAPATSAPEPETVEPTQGRVSASKNPSDGAAQPSSVPTSSAFRGPAPAPAPVVPASALAPAPAGSTLETAVPSSSAPVIDAPAAPVQPTSPAAPAVNTGPALDNAPPLDTAQSPTPPHSATPSPSSTRAPRPLVAHSTMEEYRRILLGGQPQFSAQQVADQTGTSLELVQEFWGAMGFQLVKPDQVAFTIRDVEAFSAWAHLIDSGAVDLATARSLAQAQSHLADRLALWQVEALVEDASRRLDLDDTSARLVALDHMREYLDVLRDTMVYAWQRQLENLLTRVDRDVSQRGHEEARRRFPLTRSLGFADMVSFTASSSIMGDKMVALIERFEDVCRTAVAASGGHVVKMIGDAVFFVADDLGTGLRLVTNLLDYLQADPQILPVRASFVRGDVFSRSGDLFGPTVNLAARLVDVAPVGRILTDASTAAAIAAGKGGSGYWLENFPSADLRGFGRVSPFLLSRVQQERSA